jgi:hypothetical protein
MVSFSYLCKSHADIIDAPLLILRFGAMQAKEELQAPGNQANLSKGGICSVAVRPIYSIPCLFSRVIRSRKNLLIPKNYLYE